MTIIEMLRACGDGISNDAADEIDRLTKSRDELAAERERLKEWLAAAGQRGVEIDRLTKSRDELLATLVSIRNIAHLAWTDPATVEESFRRIELLAKVTEKPQ
jgi:hypothetical protein